MVHEDVAIAAHKMHVYWRARVLCATAEPHRRPARGEACDRHHEEARRQLSTTALASVTGGPASPGADACGVVEHVSASAVPTVSAAPPEKRSAQDSTPEPIR